MRRSRHVLLWSAVAAAACANVTRPAATPSPGAPSSAAETTSASLGMRKFDEDVAFLQRHGAKVKVLSRADGGRIAVSGVYQARVMTSAFAADGASLGFVNRAFIEAGTTGTAFDNYGGADRFWLGPEGGQFALYFAPSKPFTFENWRTPSAFQEGEWQEQESHADSVRYARSFSIQNYAKTPFTMEITRTITLLSAEQAQASLRLAPPAGVQWVGFRSENRLTNTSTQAWTEAQGLPSIWILGMFNPAPDTRIILPFEKEATGLVVNDSYFGQVGAERLLVNHDKGFVLFKADGRARGKVGLSPSRAKDVLGSYSAPGELLTIVRFTKPAGATRYVDNSWEISTKPYGGDVSNAYNDGPVEPGKPSLGGFYELESSSPAAALAPHTSLAHTHDTFHFQGPRAALEAIARTSLGVSLADVESAWR